MSVPLIRWDGPDAYAVAFSTRLGGVSDGPYESLNLGRMHARQPENVDENRRRLCETLASTRAACDEPAGPRLPR